MESQHIYIRSLNLKYSYVSKMKPCIKLGLGLTAALAAGTVNALWQKFAHASPFEGYLMGAAILLPTLVYLFIKLDNAQDKPIAHPN
jgi:hypothetical protein